MEVKKLYLSRTDKKISGVCGGIAKFTNADSTIIRLLWGFATVFYGFGLIAYIVAALIIPAEPYETYRKTQQDCDDF
ncbi:MAG: PspC domain-containing protein [Alkaliphilus sp.]